MLVLLLLGSLLASEPIRDPFTHDASLTTGRIEGFRELYGDPAALAGALEPSEAMPAASPPAGQASRLPSEDAPEPRPPHLLPIVNTASAWADVRVSGVRIGVVGPFAEAAIHDVAAGTYAVELTLPNGFVVARSVASEGSSETAPPAGSP